jgi:hypothetical protein
MANCILNFGTLAMRVLKLRAYELLFGEENGISNRHNNSTLYKQSAIVVDGKARQQISEIYALL